jgi:predicted small lipoprotein YifL
MSATWDWRAWSVAVVVCGVVGCGTVGPPVPPEDVGVAPLIERQKKEQARQGEPPGSALDTRQTDGSQLTEPVGQDVDLPPLRPVGGR